MPDIVPAHGAFFDDSDPRTGAVTVFINRGDGSFETGQAYQTSSPGQRMGSWSVAADDLNGDGLRDLAAANPGAHSVSVLLNRGAGTFLPAVNYRIRGQPWDVAIRDLNGDHQADIVIATPKTVSALMNSGSGSFARSAHTRLARTLWLLPWPT